MGVAKIDAVVEQRLSGDQLHRPFDPVHQPLQIAPILRLEQGIQLQHVGLVGPVQLGQQAADQLGRTAGGIFQQSQV
ncbi:hypothetical protein D3C85_1482110 [compost metagenome]